MRHRWTTYESSMNDIHQLQIMTATRIIIMTQWQSNDIELIIISTRYKGHDSGKRASNTDGLTNKSTQKYRVVFSRLEWGERKRLDTRPVPVGGGSDSKSLSPHRTSLEICLQSNTIFLSPHMRRSFYKHNQQTTYVIKIFWSLDISSLNLVYMQ